MSTDPPESSARASDLPILFVVFNRADTAERVFRLIREAKPRQLFVAADGPRDSKQGEREACKQARAVIQVDWDCELKTLYQEKNLGCRLGMSTAIDWFFKNVEEGVILEDDCLFSKSFLPYCAELLERYRDDDRVMMICGSNFEFGRKQRSASYYFSHLAHVWGWATWRSAWRHFDLSIPSLPSFEEDRWLEHFCGSRRVAEFWLDRFRRCRDGTVDAWSYAWIASIWSQGGLTTIPSRNLVSNIGFGSAGTNTKRRMPFADMPLNELEWPLRHPPHFMPDFESDLRTAKDQYILRTFVEKAWRRVRSTLSP